MEEKTSPVAEILPSEAIYIEDFEEITENAAETSVKPTVTSTPSVKRERRRLVLGLGCTILATLAVVVYGTNAVQTFRQRALPLPEKLMGEVLGVSVTYSADAQKLPELPKIPPQTVYDGASPGAAEHESAPETDDAPPAPEENLTEMPIINVDFSVGADPYAIINETPYEPDVNGLLDAPAAVPSFAELCETYGEDAPVVLILHTHGTEAYLPHLSESVPNGESFRSLDAERGVVSVGREMKRVFESHGIGVIHIETMLDAESFSNAYYNSAEVIRSVCREYPSVSYVFDVHRDAMVSADGSQLRPRSASTVTVEGVSPAQIMLVVGTDHAGSGHASWRDNMALALKLQRSALSFDPHLMRPLNLRSASFNQQYTAGSLLVEVGSAANSVEEARLAGVIFAEAASRVITGEEAG